MEKSLKELKEINSLLKKREEIDIIKEIENFHQKRINEIEKGNILIPLSGKGKIIIHLIPKYSLKNQKYYDLLKYHQKNYVITAVGHEEYIQCYNFEGMAYIFPEENTRKAHKYIQIFRNGIIESVDSVSLDLYENLLKNILQIEKNIIYKIIDGLAIERELGVKLPVFLFIDMLEMLEKRIPNDYMERNVNSSPINIRNLSFKKIKLDEFSINFKEIKEEIFDVLWNASGYPECLDYKYNKFEDLNI